MRAVQDATPAVWGVILQFPFYAGIAGMITATHLNEQLASLFVSVSTPATFPPLVAHLLRGARRVRAVGRIEVGDRGAVRDGGRARSCKVHLGWVVAGYDLGEALANLVQPFWMLPILGLFQLRRARRDGLHVRRFFVLLPVVLAARHAARPDAVLPALNLGRSARRRRQSVHFLARRFVRGSLPGGCPGRAQGPDADASWPCHRSDSRVAPALI